MFTSKDDLRKALLCLTLLSLSWSGSVTAQEAPTYAKNIAPILQEKCQSCHNPDGIGPMSFMSYEEVRPWAPLIKDRTTKRIMPPWHIDKTVGIQDFANDASLSDEQIALIAAWSDAGAPLGDPADLPEPISFPPGGAWALESELGPPDIVVRSKPYDVVANGQDQWWEPEADFPGLDQTRFLKAAEFKPAYPLGKKVVHHGHATLVSEDGEYAALARYGVGKSWETYPEDIGVRIPKDGKVQWNLHYFPIGEKVEDDVVEVGLWFYPPDHTPELVSRGEEMFRVDNPDYKRGQDIVIAPNSYQVLQGTHVLESPAIIHSFRPHLHMRGKVMTMEAIYPDGRKETINQVNKYDHNWQIAYQYSEEAKPILPSGTVLQFTSVFDNTANNPINPDPDQWVVFGRRGVDEMSHAWVGITHINEEQYIQAVADRRAREETLRVSQ